MPRFGGVAPGPGPGERAEGDCQTAGPVDAALRRVGARPRVEVARESFGVAFVPGVPEGATEHGEILLTIQLPDDLFIARHRRVEIINATPMRERRALSRDGF